MGAVGHLVDAERQPSQVELVGVQRPRLRLPRALAQPAQRRDRLGGARLYEAQPVAGPHLADAPQVRLDDHAGHLGGGGEPL